MKKILMIIAVAAFFAACSSTTINDEDAKRQELQQYKQEMHDLKLKIDALEKELSNTGEEEIVNVKVSDIASQTFEHFIEVTGNVEADLNINVSPESSGIIESILVKEGDKVSKGQILAKLKVDALQRTLDELKIQLDLATTNFNRQKNLWDQNIGSEMQFLQAKTNKESLEKRIEGLEAQIDMSDVTSPVDGVVDVIYQKKGAIGSPQLPFAKVVNIERINIYADVSETYLTKVKEGDKVKINFPALNRETEARIQQMGNVIDPNNRTFRIKVSMNNPDKMIKPNLVSIIKIRDYVAEDAIVVPTLYVREDFKGDFTFIADSDNGKNVAKKVYVTTGVTDNNMTEVTKGLTAGMKIISEGYNQIVDGTSIRF
jgi:RND family efflux transporter MFP subunit